MINQGPPDLLSSRTAPRRSPGTPTRAYAKTDVRYWKGRLFKRSNDNWQVQIAYCGHQEKFPLKTPNQTAAAAQARDIYLSLRAVGWDETRTRFKPRAVDSPEVEGLPTVGDFLREVEAVSGLRPGTFAIYSRKFRRIVAGVTGLNEDEREAKRKFDYVKGGSRAYHERIDRTTLAALTPDRIQQWSARYLQTRGRDPLARKRAQATLNSLIRGGKALFSKRFRNFIRLELPTRLPFEGVSSGKVVNHRYQSAINLQELVRSAYQELQPELPQVFLIFMLALGAGMRRAEIDGLLWSQVDLEKSLIRIETTAFKATKSAGSEDKIDIDAELVRLLKDHRERRTSDFVIESPRPARQEELSYAYYRCEKLFDRLIAWLKGKGVNSISPIHTLRKEYGSQICQEYGLFAASVALRHSDIKLTRDHYVDKRQPVTLSFEFLKTEVANAETKDHPV